MNDYDVTPREIRAAELRGEINATHRFLERLVTGLYGAIPSDRLTVMAMRLQQDVEALEEQVAAHVAGASVN